MKELLQTMLIGCGMVGLICSTPVAIYAWFLRRGLTGDLARDDKLMLYGPLICVAFLVTGFVWRRFTSKRESRRSPGQLTEDGPGAAG